MEEFAHRDHSPLAFPTLRIYALIIGLPQRAYMHSYGETRFGWRELTKNNGGVHSHGFAIDDE